MNIHVHTQSKGHTTRIHHELARSIALRIYDESTARCARTTHHIHPHCHLCILVTLNDLQRNTTRGHLMSILWCRARITTVTNNRYFTTNVGNVATIYLYTSISHMWQHTQNHTQLHCALNTTQPRERRDTDIRTRTYVSFQTWPRKGTSQEVS